MWLALGAAAHAADEDPSFDCVTALTKDEIIICAALSSEDRDLAKLFDDVAASLPEGQRATLAEDQRRWVVQRNVACGVSNDTDLKPAIWRRLVECFREQYRTRRDYLWTAHGGQPASPPTLPPSKLPDLPEFETVWRAAAADPPSAMEKLRTYPNAQARLYADILEHALSSESDVEFTKFAEGVLWVTGSGDGDRVHISCSLIQKFPRLLELTRGFHGGSRDNFTPRTDCDVDETGLPASVDQFLDHLDRSIRNRITRFACGTSRYGWFKEVRVADIRMAFVPETYLGSAQPTGHWIAADWAPPTAIPLERWSYGSLPNRLAFENSVKPSFLQTRTDLTAHYEQAFGMTTADALTAAHRALWDQVEDLASDPGDYYPYPVQPASQAILLGAPADEIAKLLSADVAPSELEYLVSPPMDVAATRPDVIRMLAAKGYPVGDALMIAAAHGDAAAVEAIVNAGADVNQATRGLNEEQILKAWRSIRNCASVPRPDDVNGAQTALMIAAQSGRLSVIERLMELGADKDVVDSRGYRAVDYLQLRNADTAERLSASQMAMAKRLLD